MPSLLLALLLLVLFTDAAQASSDFPFDPFTVDSSLGPPYGDPEGLLSFCTICDLGALCTHGIQRVLVRLRSPCNVHDLTLASPRRA